MLSHSIKESSYLARVYCTLDYSLIAILTEKMYSNFKLVFVIVLYLFAGVFHCYSAFHISPDDSKIDDRYDKLIVCLTKSGITDGKIFPRNDGPEYNELNYQWNTFWYNMAPLVYLKATTVSDIRIAVKCCVKTKIRIVPRSGGHSYVKNGFGDSNSLVIDLSSINQIKIDKQKMIGEIGPGARNGQIMYESWRNGCLVSQGICPSVGMGGLALGGGYGHFSRLLGLAADNVIEMEMVDARGRLLVVNNSTNKDLFYALRGGGGGNFGIVSKFIVKVYDSPRSIIYSKYEYSFKKEFKQVFKAWQKIVSIGLGNHISSMVELEQDLITLELFAINIGNRPDVTVTQIKELGRVVGLPKPGPGASITSMTHEEFIMNQAQGYSNRPLTDIAEVAQMTKHNKVYNKKVKSFFVRKVLNNKQIDKFTKLLTVYLPNAGVYLDFNGGAINNNPGTCFIHRQDLYSAQLKPLNSQGVYKSLETDAAKIRFFEATKALFKHDESYQNYIDRDMKDYLARFYGSELYNLIRIKQKHDPTNVFYSCESIPVYPGQPRICNYQFQ